MSLLPTAAFQSAPLELNFIYYLFSFGGKYLFILFNLGLNSGLHACKAEHYTA
jgi:hypothetical protein